MSWTPQTGLASYSNGKTINHKYTNATITLLKDPYKNILGSQDYGTLYTGNQGKTITPGTGLKNVASPTPGYKED